MRFISAFENWTMETLSLSETCDDVEYESKEQSKLASSVDLDSYRNDGRPNSNRSNRRHRRHSSRHSIAEGNCLPSPTASPKDDTTRRESLTSLSARENLSSASSTSHWRQTVGGKLGFIAFEDILSDVISLCPQMTSWLNDSLDNVVCVNCDLESSKEKALPAFYYANTSLKGPAGVDSKSRPSTVSLSVDQDRRTCDDSCPSQRPTPTGRRSKKKRAETPDDDYRCFARSPSSLRIIYEPADF